MPFSHMPERIADWAAHFAPHQAQLLSAEGLEPLETLPACGGYVVLMGRELSKFHLSQLQVELFSESQQAVCFAPFCVGEVQVLVLGTRDYDPELMSWIKDQEWSIDGAHVARLPRLGEPGLLLMDMDSTAIQIECIDEIARLAGVGEQVAAVTAAAMQGKLEFADSLRNRVALLKDADEAILEQVAADIPLMPGLTELVAATQAAGWKVAIASGGFTRFAGHLQRLLGLDHIEANDLEVVDGRLTGRVEGRIVDAQVKAETLLALRERYGISAAQTVAIGDGANDLPMLKNAALGVALHAKPVVREQAQVAIRGLDLEAVLCLLLAGDRVGA